MNFPLQETNVKFMGSYSQSVGTYLDSHEVNNKLCIERIKSPDGLLGIRNPYTH
jgi:hypothetical protein